MGKGNRRRRNKDEANGGSGDEDSNGGSGDEDSNNAVEELVQVTLP